MVPILTATAALTDFIKLNLLLAPHDEGSFYFYTLLFFRKAGDPMGASNTG